MTGDKRSGSVLINRYEREVNRADMETAAVVARTLGVPLAYLFAEDDDQAELLLAFAKLSKQGRADILEMIRQLSAAREAKELPNEG